MGQEFPVIERGEVVGVGVKVPAPAEADWEASRLPVYVEAQLKGAERAGLAVLREGCERARLEVGGRPVVSNAMAIRWMLAQIGAPSGEG